MPRKSKKRLDFPATVPVPVAEVLEQLPIAQAIESPPPEPPAPTYVEQLGPRPTEPRKRSHREPASVYTSVQNGFKLEQNGPFRQFRFAEEPPREWKDQLERAGFAYVPYEKVWSAPASWQTRDASDRLALAFDGKVISNGRGA